jgi:integrase
LIAAMSKPRPPYLQRHVTRHGTVFWYVRVGRGDRVRIRGKYGSPEFMVAYHAAVTGSPNAPAGPQKASKGTLAWLADRYRETSAWSSLSAATRRQRENILKHVLAASGDVAAGDIARKDIVAGVDRRRDRPAAARHFLETIRGLFQWALDAELVTVDPTQGIKAPRKSRDGHHTWTDDEIAAYEARWPLGTRERLAFDLLLYTGLRRGDVVTLGRQHVRNGVAMLRTEKTGEPVAIPILAPLAASIAAGPCGDLAFIAGDRGKPMVKESFGTWFGKACKAAGVPGRAHGLRKAGATRAANAGATEHELMALYGWSEPRTAAIYTRKANRQRLAAQASAKITAAQNANVYALTQESDALTNPQDIENKGIKNAKP